MWARYVSLSLTRHNERARRRSRCSLFHDRCVNGQADIVVISTRLRAVERIHFSPSGSHVYARAWEAHGMLVLAEMDCFTVRDACARAVLLFARFLPISPSLWTIGSRIADRYRALCHFVRGVAVKNSWTRGAFTERAFLCAVFSSPRGEHTLPLCTKKKKRKKRDPRQSSGGEAVFIERADAPKVCYVPLLQFKRPSHRALDGAADFELRCNRPRLSEISGFARKKDVCEMQKNLVV